jgi:uncharacterized ubiquitin-like protein YukD
MSEGNQKDQEYRISKSWGHRRFVTLRTEHGHEEVDLEMPGDQPIGGWMPDLIKVLNWPTMDADRPLDYRLRTDTGKILSDNETLNDAGIENSDVLWIALVEPETEAEEADLGDQEKRLQKMDQKPVGNFKSAESDQPPVRKGDTLSAPREARVSITEPSLVSASGCVFVLGTPPILIGRRSSGYQPDIDLTDLDEEYVSSRRHATILKEGERWVLLVRETTNGTFVNGVGFSPGERYILKDGDVIQFGFEGAELMFWSGAGGSLPASFFRIKSS